MPLSPRRRRLRRTVLFLALALVAGALLGTFLHLRNRPQPYRPDERTSDITRSLDRTLPPDAPKPLLRDVTRAAGLGEFRNFHGDRTSQLPEDMGPGLAWGDFNNDGYEDVFLVSAGGALNLPDDQLAPCELYQNLGDGTFRRVTAFPETRIHGMGAAWADYDGDGYLDLVVTGYNAIRLFQNEGGTGAFVRNPRLPDRPGFWSGAAWGDYDNDRRPDLYVCGYVQYVANDADRARISEQLGSFVPYTLNPASYTPALNLLFHNNADGTFTDVAPALDVTNPEGRSLGALWHDFDGDGWLDLYVANDLSDNVLYHNLGGRFEDVSHPAYVADYRSAMGLAAGDFDRDGDDDLFITHWVGQENALYANVTADLGRLSFMDIADQKGLGQIAIPYVGWGTGFVDLDGDGWLDLVVANGSTLEIDGPAPKHLQPQEPFLFWNQKGDFFHNLAPLSPVLSGKHVSRGLAIADYDNDGAPDILLAHLGEGVQLLRNEMQTGHWLKVRLRSRTASGAPRGFGDDSTVIAQVGNARLRRTVSGVSYLSQDSRVLHFGLGAATRVDRLEVRWHAGTTNTFPALDANATWEITEGDPDPRRVAVPNAPDPPRLAAGAAPPAAASATPGASAAGDRAKVIEFWNRERAAMNALKTEQNLPKAIALFRAALELDPKHEDSHYYLGQALAARGEIPAALDQFHELTRLNPQSHRGFQQWGNLRALSARSDADLAEAETFLNRAHALNPEETGALLVLGEVALLRGQPDRADQRLSAACRTNPRAAGGFFLRGYLAWKQDDRARAAQLLGETRTALGKDWQPQGATAEGDVKRKQFVEGTPLSRFWQQWNGQPDADTAYAPLDAFLRARPQP